MQHSASAWCYRQRLQTQHCDKCTREWLCPQNPRSASYPVCISTEPILKSCDVFRLLQAEVANALLRRVHLSAALSAEPVLALLGTLPRDLREGFLPMVPHVISTLTALVDEGKLI